jgi:hypothetical protein
MGARAQVDESQWPRVVVKWPAEVLSDEEFRRVVLQISELTARRQLYAVIHDARVAVRATPVQRSFAAEEQKRTAELSRKWLAGAAIVVSSPLTAGVVTAINWISPPPYPQKVFSSMAEAEKWITAQLASRQRISAGA